MKALLTLMTALALYAPMSFAATEVTDKNVKQTLEASVDKGDSVVLVFYATWCPNCKQFDPMVAQAEKNNPKVKFFRIDVDKNPNLGSQVQGIPTTVVFKNKKIVDVLVGRAEDQKSLDARLKKDLGK